MNANVETKAKPTDGPWTFVPRHIAESEPEVRHSEGWIICATSSDDLARLIASAPDLLEALKEAQKLAKLMEDLCACQGDDDYVWGVQKKINDAICKAEGRSAEVQPKTGWGSEDAGMRQTGEQS